MTLSTSRHNLSIRESPTLKALKSHQVSIIIIIIFLIAETDPVFLLAGVGSVTAVMFFTDYVFLAVQTLGGMIVTLGTRENGTNNMVPFAFQEFNWTRSEFQNGPRPLDLTHQVQFTRAIAMDEFSKPRIALSARFNSTIYKLIVFNCKLHFALFYSN
jgi:hypothetical protein